MNADDEKFLRISKEIIIKFIEMGRVAPGDFEDQFKNVFWTLKRTVVDSQAHRLDVQGLEAEEDSEDSEDL